jgi:hypothetical protein
LETLDNINCLVFTLLHGYACRCRPFAGVIVFEIVGGQSTSNAGCCCTGSRIELDDRRSEAVVVEYDIVGSLTVCNLI